MKLVSRPLSEQNSIEAVAFVVTLERVLLEREVESILTLEGILKDDLPRVAKVSDVHVNLSEDDGPQSVSMQQQKVAGIMLQKVREDGRPSWALRVAGTNIIVNCWEYTRWAEVWPIAKRYLLAALKLIEVDGVAVTNVITQNVDKFLYEKNSEKEYCLSELFRDDCPFLTKKSRNCGSLWHVHQGWFEQTNDEQGARLLNVVNIANGVAGPSELVTTIDHQAQTQFTDGPISISDLVREADAQESLLSNIFESHHKLNRDVLMEMLQDEKLAAIGLK